MDFAGMKRRDLQALCKQHGLPAGGTNAALVARLAACSALQGASADAGEEVEVPARKGCLKRPVGVNDFGEAKKAVSFALEHSRGRRTRQLSAVVAAGTPPAGSTDAEVAGRGGGQRKRAEAVGASVDGDSAAAEAYAAATVPVRRSRRNSVALSDVEAVQELAADKKRKRKSQEKEEETAIVESKRSGRKTKSCEPAVQKSAKVEAPGRITRSCAVASTVTETIVVEKKRRTIEYKQSEVDLPTDLEVPRNDAPVTRALRNRVVQVKEPARQSTRKSIVSATLDEDDKNLVAEKGPEPEAPVTRSRRTQDVYEDFQNAKGDAVVKQPAVKEPPRRLTCKSIVSSMLEEEDKHLIVEKSSNEHARRSKRKSVVFAEGCKGDEEGTQNAKGADVVKQPTIKEPARRSTCKSIVSSVLEEEDKHLIVEKSPEAHGRRSKRKSIALVENNKGDEEGIKNAKGADVVKQPARRSTRTSIVSFVLEEVDKHLIVEKSPEAHVRRSKRKSIMLVGNCKGDEEGNQNAKDADAVKQPARRSTRKSIVSSVLEEEDKHLIVEKSPEAHVRRSRLKSAVLVENCKGDEEEIQNARGADVVKQPTLKEPSRRTTRKSIISSMLEKEDKNFISEKSPETHIRKSKRKSVVLVKDCKDDGKEIRNANGEDVAKQLPVQKPVRRSTRNSIASGMLEKDKNDLIAAKKPEAHDKRSARKSVRPHDMINKVNQDHIKMVRNEGKCGDEEKQLKAKGPVSLSRQSVATVVSDTENMAGHEKTKSEAPMTRSTRKSVAHNVVEKGDMDQTEMVGREPSGVGSRNLNARAQIAEHDGSGAMATSEIELQTEVSVHSPYRSTHKSSGNELSHGNKTHSVEEAKCKDMMIREAIHDTFTRGNESSNRMEEIRQCNDPVEELPSSPSLVTSHEECMVQTVHNVISGSKSADAQNPDIYSSHEGESSDPSKQTQEYYVATDDGLLSETIIEEMDQSSSITEVLLNNGTVSEYKTLRDGGEVNFGNRSIQIVNASSDEVGLETSNTTAVLIVDAEAPMVENTAVNTDTKQSNAEAAPTDLSFCDVITVKVTEPQFAGQSGSQGVRTDASESVPPISDSKQESHNTKQSIQDDDMRKCLSKGIKGNTLSPNLHSDGANADSILLALDAAKGSSSDRSGSSFGLDFLFAEERKESSSGNDTSTVVEVDYGSKHNACVTPSFCVRSDCGMECENVQPLGYDSDKTLDVGHGVAHEEFIAEEKSNDEHVSVECDLKTKSDYEAVGLYMESNCTLTENSTRRCDDEQAIMPVQQDAVQGGTLEKPLPCSTAPECKHECRLLEEAELRLIRNERCSPRADESPLGLHPLFSQESLDDSMEHGGLASATSHTEIGADQLKDCLVKGTVEKPTVSQLISNHGTHLVTGIDDGMHMPQQNNEAEGLPEVSHEELASPSLSGFSVDEYQRKEIINSAEPTCKAEGNRNIFHSEDLNASCEESNLHVSVDSDCGISATVLSCSLHAADTANDDVHLGSNTEVQHSSKKGHNIEDKENQVASRPSPDDTTEAATAKCIESGMVVLPKDYPADHYLRHEHLDDFSMEKSSEESAMFGVKNVSIAGTVGNPSFGSAMPEHNGVLFEEVVNNVKTYVGTCPSNPGELLIEQQSMSSQENTKESDRDNLALSVCGLKRDESTIFEQHVDVHSGSDLSQLQSNDCLDESIQCSKMEVLHQGHNNQCNEDISEEKVGSEPLSYGNTEPATAKYIESEVDLLPVEERSELQDRHLNSVPESAKVVESSLRSNSDVRDIVNNGSVGTVYEKFLFGDESDSRVETVHNYVKACMSDPRELLMELESSDESIEGLDPDPRELLMELESSSNGTIEDLDPRDNTAFLKTEREADESTICHVENQADTTVSSEPGVYLGPSHGFSRDEGKQDCMTVSLHDNEEGLLKGNYLKDTSAYLLEDAHNMERDITTQEILCDKEKEGESLRPSNYDIVQGYSHSKEYGICQSNVNEISSETSSRDAEVFCQDRVEECHKINEDQATPAVLEKDMPKASPFERTESTIMLDCEGEEYSFSCDKSMGNVSCSGLAKNSMFKLPGDCHLDSCQKQDVPDVLCAPQSPEKSAYCHDESVLGPGACYSSREKCTNESSNTHWTSCTQDRYNEISEHKITSGFTACDVPEAASTARSNWVTGMVLAAGTSELPDEQLNTKTEGLQIQEHNCVIDKDTSSLLDAELAGKSKASNLPEDVQCNASSEHSLPTDLSAPRSPKKSVLSE